MVIHTVYIKWEKQGGESSCRLVLNPQKFLYSTLKTQVASTKSFG